MFLNMKPIKAVKLSTLIAVALELSWSYLWAADGVLPDKPIPDWPVPQTLRVLQMDPDDRFLLMTVASLQGLVNRQAPDGNIVYIEMETFPDEDWRRYYVSAVGLNVVETTLSDLLDWAKTYAGVQYYIVIDPYFSFTNIEELHLCTINIASTMAGVFGNALPVHPDNVPLLQEHGYQLLPDVFREQLGRGGDELRSPDAFDLRNQWKSRHSDAPWNTRRDAYRWAIDTLLPLCDHHAVSFNQDLPTKDGNSICYNAWMNDYSVGTRLFHFYLNPTPEPEARMKTDYDLDFYREILQRSGPFTMVRGWHWDEPNHIKLISEARCFHAGSVQMANSSVHAAVSPLFTEPFVQRQISPDSVTLDADTIYLTFSVTDGDQFGVVYRYYESDADPRDRVPIWRDSNRGKVPLNWTMSGLMYHFGRGIMRWFFDEATDNDYFTADLPVGYAWFYYEYFGDSLEDYDTFANDYLAKSGLPVADFVPPPSWMEGTAFPTGFPLFSDPTETIHVNMLSHAIALREGYDGGFYQGIFWPEERPLMPHIRNAYAANISGYQGVFKTPEEIAADIIQMATIIPWRPLFMHVTWINWFNTPTSLHRCLEELRRRDPSNHYQVVGMPEFVALAQKAKLTGQYPMEFYPHRGGESGLEGPYLWEDRGSITSPRKEEMLGRATSNGSYVTYKFNIAPAKTAKILVEIEGDNYRMDASPDNQTWTPGLISGKSSARRTEIADLTPHLNARGSVYVKFTGETKLWHVKVDYRGGPVSVEREDDGIDEGYRLSQNFPNPFNPSTVIQFTVPKASMVTLKVYDVLGREISTLVNDNLAAGVYNVLFETENIPSGMYFYVLRAGGHVLSNKMMLVK